MPSPIIQIIDLDDPSYSCLADLEATRQLTIALTVAYCKGGIPNSALITLKVWLGLLDPIPASKQRLLPALSLAVAAARMDSTNPSFLMGACMIMGEIMRIFTLDEQKIILRRLEA